jgi:hypothetical protein
MREICKDALRFLRQERKWWLIPLLVTFLILAGMVLFTSDSTPLSPFLYPTK